HVERETRTFRTETASLIELFDWLSTNGCTHVVMESTGVYWKPVWRVLEGGFELVLANATDVKNVPGRKSDVSDAQWLADLLAHGLVRGSFVPDENGQDLRDLTRTRKQLVREQVQHRQRIQKVLERCNVKLASVISDVTGPSGRRILEALIAGERDPAKLADLADSKIKLAKWLPLARSLSGSVRPHDTFMLGVHLRAIDALQAEIDAIGARLEEILREPFREAIRRLTTIPGVSDRVAEIIVAEIGVDMSIFATAGHLVSWAGLCPRMDESAGKRRNTRVRKGAPWLKPILVQAAWAAVRKRDSYLGARFLRLQARRGTMKAIVATAAKMLVVVYHLLRDGVVYNDLGAAHLDNLDRARVARRLVHRLEALGYSVDLQSAA
ncbi:MAG: IS110 family transposase, partial [Myxococcota bacterium]